MNTQWVAHCNPLATVGLHERSNSNKPIDRVSVVPSLAVRLLFWPLKLTCLLLMSVGEMIEITVCCKLLRVQIGSRRVER